MTNLFGLLSRSRHAIAATVALACLGFTTSARANEFYNPPSFSGGEVSGTLSDTGIPTGQGGYAYDYVIDLNEGDRVEIEAFSESFDTILTLIGPDGSTMAENDDGPDGTTNSLIYTRLTESGRYTIRIRAFGVAGEGTFTVNLTRLRPI